MIYQSRSKLTCSSASVDDDFDDEENDDDEVEPVVSNYTCEDCNYRWEVVFEDDEQAELDEVQYCPMCGTNNTTLL